MPKKAKRILVFSIGVVFILLGLVGFVLPFLQGFLFVAIGLILVSFCFPKIRPWIHKHTKKYPFLFKIIERFEKWLTKIIGEI
ncbi:MAG TPA: hypothetical protein VGO63_00515 [Candidatus Paceibacterota bacterium]|jgi:uncharacterized membrane protein YbaN (DUF454 family)|nr:hypothetical protein [Candidatus Paceibacterota bacterium]